MQATNTQGVMVAGAGPCGMVAAAALASQGIPVTVFESCGDLPIDLRASTFHPPTLDLLDRFRGVTDALIKQGLIARTWQYRDRHTGPVATWDLGMLSGDTNHPYRLQAEQWRLTSILAEHLRAWPHARLLFDHEVVAAEQTADQARFRVRTPEGEQLFAGAWAIAADGANSAVRRSLGMPFDGITLPEMYLTLSTAFDFARHLPELTYVNYVADPEEWLVLLRVAATWRVLFPTRPGETREQVLDDASVQRRLSAVVRGDRPFEVVHKTIYHVHERVAPDYRRGRILLAGDAAHINNPLGGMGMNGGIHDAFNLAEKLGQVWRGEVGPDLLDRYTRQRRKVAIDFVQANALRNREALRETDPALRKQRQDDMRRVAADPTQARAFLLRSSMISALREAELVE